MRVKSLSDSVSWRERWLNASPAVFGLLLWSLMVLALDGLLFVLIGKLVVAQWYPSVPGEITQSAELKKEGGGKTTAAICFRYSVNDKEFIGDQLHFLNLRDASRVAEVQQTLQRFPLGQSVEVIYNPNDPNDSALDRSLNGMPLAFALFLTPFNLLLVGGWSWLARRVNGTHSLPLRRDEDRWCLLPTNGQPWMVALTAAGVVSLTLVLVVSIGGWSDNREVMIAAWALLFGLSCWAYWHTRSLVQRETPVLVLDDALATVTWPPTVNAPEFSIARSHLLAIELSDEHPPHGNDKAALTYSILLRFTGADGQSATRLAFQTTNSTEASSMMEWMEEWTGLVGRQD